MQTKMPTISFFMINGPEFGTALALLFQIHHLKRKTITANSYSGLMPREEIAIALRDLPDIDLI